MCPIPVDVIEKSCKQVELLFDHFLRIDSSYEDFLPKKQTGESYEVQYESFTRGGLQRDSAKRLSSGNEFRVVPRGTVHDQTSLDNDIARKRRSLELRRRDVATPPPGSGALLVPAAPAAPTLQRDSREITNDERMEVQHMQTSHSPMQTSTHSPPFRRSKIDDSRRRPLSQGPTEQQMHDAALVIAGVGDQIDRQYASRMNDMKNQLSHFIRAADVTLSYEQFAVHVNGLVGDDRDWTNFVFMMHLSRRVLVETSTIMKPVSNYFRRYLGAAFAEQIAEKNNVVDFVSDRPSSV